MTEGTIAEDEVQCLQEYAKGKGSFESVASFFEDCARTGITRHEWPVVSAAIAQRAREIANAKEENSSTAAKASSKSRDAAKDFEAALSSLPAPPFTVQRLFEILTESTTDALTRDRFWANVLQLARVSVTVDKCPPTHEFEMKPRRAIGKPAMATIKEGDTGDEEKQDELAFQMDADDDDDDGLSLLDRQLGAGMDSTPDAGNRSDDADHGDDEAPGAADADENNKGDKTDNGDQHTASAQANASDAGDGDNALAGSNKAQAETTPSASSPLSSNTTTTAHDAADAADADSNNDSHGRDGPPPKVAKRADSPNATQQQ